MKLKEALHNSLTEKELALLVRGYDIIGDIAITIIPQELIKHESLIGNTILNLNRNIKVVTKRSGNYAGKFRTIPLDVIAGENRKETLCREFGLKLLVNPEKVYYSVRSGNERKRIANQIIADEKILVMFSGIGVYPLMLSKHSPASHITGVELNKEAHIFAKKNIAINKIKNVSIHHGDVRDIVPSLGEKFDRIIMPLPKSSQQYVTLALSVLKAEGIVHAYVFQQKDCIHLSVEYLKQQCKNNRRELISSCYSLCGHLSPSQYRICIDGVIA